MDTLLDRGDHATDPRGLPVSVDGAQELIQRALLRLGIRRGSFVHDPALGSELWRLSRDSSAATMRTAHSYVQEALLPLPELTVEEVAVTFPQPDELHLAVVLCCEDARWQLELTL